MSCGQGGLVYCCAFTCTLPFGNFVKIYRSCFVGGPLFISNKARSSGKSVICALFILIYLTLPGRCAVSGNCLRKILGSNLSNGALVIGMCIVFFYAVFGGMKGINLYSSRSILVSLFSLWFSYLFISMQLTGSNSQLGLEVKQFWRHLLAGQN